VALTVTQQQRAEQHHKTLSCLVLFSFLEAEGMGFEPTTPCGAPDFESGRWPVRLPSITPNLPSSRAIGNRALEPPMARRIAPKQQPPAPSRHPPLRSCAPHAQSLHCATTGGIRHRDSLGGDCALLAILAPIAPARPLGSFQSAAARDGCCGPCRTSPRTAPVRILAV
jgi:hypothetical protein